MSSSLRNNILNSDRAVPRYTSYPTAPHFKPLEVTDNTRVSLPKNEAISLYLHVPFCRKMCWYCGCHTKVTRQYEPVANYVELLLKELSIQARHHPNKPSVSHIHFGGGTPGILEPNDFERVMSAVQKTFTILPDAEIAIEIDPRGLTEDHVKSYAKMGINRVSLGSQDFNDDVMETVNRAQPFELSQKAVELFRSHGITQVNLDLMYGLPGQTLEKMSYTMGRALSLKPSRIAFFGYAHVPWMKKHMRLLDENALPDKNLRFDLFATGAKILEESGYTSIGIDHFVSPDDTMMAALETKTLRRNFQGYTTDQATTMVGVGVSSIGRTADSYYQNFPDMPRYRDAIEAGRLPLAKSCPITDQDKVRGAIIERLMCDFTVDLKDYEGDYREERDTLRHYAEQGFIDLDGTCITIHKEARPVARLVAAVFDEYLPPETEQRHSKAV